LGVVTLRIGDIWLGEGRVDVFALASKNAASASWRMNLFRSTPDAHTISAGVEICRQGEPGDTMFVVVEGTVEIVRGDRLLGTVGPGEFFGEMSLIEKAPRAATARAKTDCRIATVDEKRFLFMVQQTPYFALEMLRTISSRLRERLQDV